MTKQLSKKELKLIEYFKKEMDEYWLKRFNGMIEELREKNKFESNWSKIYWYRKCYGLGTSICYDGLKIIATS